MTEISQAVIYDFVKAKPVLLERARAATGLHDFGPDDFQQGLDLMLECFDKEVVFSSDTARIASAGYIVDFLSSRLYSEQGWKTYPEALRTEIRKPLVITGIVRSGTTALHRLLSMDRQFQGIQTWISRSPMPRPARGDWPSHPLYQRAKASVDAMIAAAPELLEDHMFDADGVEENINLLPQSFCNNQIPSMWEVPAYDAWYRRQDETASYQRLADNLKLIGLYEQDKRWLLKNPTDVLAMDAVLNVFPDAMVIQTHRDPVQAIPSVVNLIGAARRIFEGPDSDPNLVMRRETGFWAAALTRMERARQRAPTQFFDVEFSDFIKDQMKTVRAIYEYFELHLTAEAEQTMRAWLDANPRRSATMQRFNAEDFGVKRSEVEAEYAFYRQQRGYA
jgi:hypothetical protein